jgi:hypothetical protein
MLPTSVIGVLAVLLLVLPGAVFYGTVRTYRPSTRPIRDVTEVVVWGTIFFLVSGLLYGAARWSGLRALPAPERLIATSGREYLTQNLFRVGLATAGLAVISAAIALAAGLLLKNPKTPRYGHQPGVDPWWQVFRREVDKLGRPHVTIERVDGTRVGGYLAWFTTERPDYAHRDLILVPWRDLDMERARAGQIGAAGEPDPRPLIAERRIVIPASQIRTLDLTYVPSIQAAESKRLLDDWARSQPLIIPQSRPKYHAYFFRGEVLVELHPVNGKIGLRLPRRRRLDSEAQLSFDQLSRTLADQLGAEPPRRLGSSQRRATSFDVERLEDINARTAFVGEVLPSLLAMWDSG